jgi:hypothetical protein
MIVTDNIAESLCKLGNQVMISARAATRPQSDHASQE